MPKGPSYLLHLLMVGCVMLVLASLMAWERFDPAAYESHLEPVRSGQEDSIKRAEFISGRLWILSDSGDLWSVSEDTGTVRQEPLGQRTLSLCAHDRAPTAIADDPTEPDFWTVRRLEGSEWLILGRVIKSDEGLVGLACGTNSLTVLTTRRMVSLNGPNQQTKLLSLRVPSRPTSVILMTPTTVLVGLAEGEFGGGLMSIDRQSGAVTDISRNTSGELCGGPLNPHCDPVNGLAPVPWKPDCAVAAIGLVHFSPHGRLTEVCSGRVERLHVGPCPYPDDNPPAGYSDGEPFCTEAFYGVARNADELMAVGTSGISVISADGSSRPEPFPAFRTFGPFEISFGREVILVWNSASRRNAISPETPLMVERDL